MQKEIMIRLHSGFEQSVHTDKETGTEYWLARDLQELLGYARWENFFEAIKRAITACENSGQHSVDHFRGSTKMIGVGKGAQREIADVSLFCFFFLAL